MPFAPSALRAHLAVAAAGVLFGTTFEVMQSAVEDVEPVPFLAVRFGLGAVVLWPFARRRPDRPTGPPPSAASSPAPSGRPPGPTPRDSALRAGVLCGLALLVGYLFQTVGLQYTTPTRSAFVTYLLVPIVPVLSAAWLRRPPAAPVVAAVALATSGLFLLTGRGLALGRGEALTLGCAVAFALHVLLLSELSPRFDTLRLTAVQLGVVGAACALPGLFLGGYRFGATAWAAALYTALAVGVGAFGLQTWGQRQVGPTRTSLLLMLEPVSAAALSALLGERLGPAATAGAGLILAAIVVAELPLGRDPAPAGAPTDR